MGTKVADVVDWVADKVTAPPLMAPVVLMPAAVVVEVTIVMA
jgi:hypothetical protein